NLASLSSMPVGASFGNAFISMRLKEPLRRLPQIVTIFISMSFRSAPPQRRREVLCDSLQRYAHIGLEATPRANASDPCREVRGLRTGRQIRIAQPAIGNDRKRDIGDGEILDHVITSLKVRFKNSEAARDLPGRGRDFRLVVLLRRHANRA